MLSIRPYQRCTKPAVNSRMKPPRQINSTLCWSSSDCSAASNAARSLPNGLLSMLMAATPFSRAVARPPASERLEITATISAGKSAALAAWISAAMFDPRPEIRIATRRFIASLGQIEMAVIDHAAFALMAFLGLDHLAQQHDALAGLGQHIGHLVDRIRLHDGDHANACLLY